LRVERPKAKALGYLEAKATTALGYLEAKATTTALGCLEAKATTKTFQHPSDTTLAGVGFMAAMQI
jgi:hypothetical protein